MSIELSPIGFVESPYKERGDAPRQGFMSSEHMKLVIDDAYVPALLGLSPQDKIAVLYWGDRSDRSVLLSTPPGREHDRGVFASRSPNRPNPIALCVAEIIKIEGNTIEVIGLDALDQSPVLDIKIHVASLGDLKRG